MTAARTCTECGTNLSKRSPRARTCSKACRAKRSRRLRQEGIEAEALSTPETRALQEVVRSNANRDVGRQAVAEALKPVLREAITQETLDALGDLVKLTPSAVVALQEDLMSDDAGIRQRAYTLVIKYSIGHPSVIRPEEEAGHAPINFHFDVPRPETTEVVDTEVIVEGEDRACDRCGKVRPPEDFADGSDRCLPCWAEQRAEVGERFGSDDS